MTATLADMLSDIQSYTEYDDVDFLAMRPTFIRAAEERIWYVVQLPFFKKNSTGALSSSTPYLQLPEDFLAPESLAITVAGEYRYLLNKDVNYIREIYPNPSTTGVPTCYALFTADETSTTIIVGPTPAANYAAELHYYYRPASLTTNDVTTNTTWLSENAYDTLLHGALSEAADWMKRTSGIDRMGDVYENRFALGLKGLQTLGEARDRKDTYRGGEKRRPE